MKAMTAQRYGVPDEVLELVDLDAPVPGDGEVVVRVRAAAVNPADWHVIRGVPRAARVQFGLRRPRHLVPGCDLAGVVEAVGPGATTFQPGDQVYGSPFMRGFGSFAELARVPVDSLARLPAGLTFEQAAAVPLAGMTALQALRDHGRLQAGQHVLVIGAAGGVGTFAVQIAKALGAEVTGVCGTRNVELVRSLGADHVIDRTREDPTSGTTRYDVVLQAAGTASPQACRRVLTPTGTLLAISGDGGGAWIGPLARVVRTLLLSRFVRQTLTTFTVTSNAADLGEMTRLIDAGAVTPVLDRSYPLVELADALRYLETGHARGKVVLAPIP